jgi:hypothetical protein
VTTSGSGKFKYPASFHAHGADSEQPSSQLTENNLLWLEEQELKATKLGKNIVICVPGLPRKVRLPKLVQLATPDITGSFWTA